MATSPNILILIADQFRYDTLSCAGHPVAHTPNLDRLANTGVRFEIGLSNPPCVPSRYAFITGFFPHQTHIIRNERAWFDDPLKPTIGMYLKEAGYATAAIGKMHWNVSPTKRGFDYRVDAAKADPVDAGPFDFLPAFERKETQEEREQKVLKYQLGGEGRFGYVGGQSPYSSAETLDTGYVNAALEYLRNRPQDRPFCLIVSINKPHPFSEVPTDYYGRIDPSQITLPDYPEGFEETDPTALRWSRVKFWNMMTDDDRKLAICRYLENVMYVDDQFGRVLDALKTEGIEDDTLVSFFSDHGDMLGDRRLYSKYSVYDGAVRVPLLMRWPGISAAGHVSDAPVELTDLVPTWLDAAGVDIPASLPGESLKRLARGEQPDAIGWRTEAFAEAHIDDDTNESSFILRGNRYKFVQSLHGKSALYDIRKDPYEFENLIDHPNYADLAHDLRDRMLRRILQNTVRESSDSMYISDYLKYYDRLKDKYGRADLEA